MTPNGLASRLLPKEKILWSGRPRQGLMLSGRDALLIPFSLLWGGFVVFWEAKVLTIPTHLTANVTGITISPMALFGIPFVAVGLFLIFGRFFVDAWLRARTSYALTDRRVLISRAGPWSSFTALALDHLPDVTLKDHANGRGTIRFGLSASAMSRGTGSWISALDSTPQFLAIDDAQRVYDLIQARASGSG